MNPRFPTLVGLKAIAVLVAVAIPLIVATHVGDLPPPVQIYILHRAESVPRSTTLGEALAAFRVRARSGNLLDVDGQVIREDAFPGSILLNGRAAPRSRRLHDGDRIRAISRPDRVEPLAHRVIHLRGRRPGNPQFYLGTAPGAQVVTTGKISGKLVSSVFRPTGRLRMPRAVALTFDDGPNPVFTPLILGVLKRMHVHATFFTIGYLVDRFPQIVRREKRAGMTVGDHSWDHPNHPPFRTLPPGVIRSEIDKAKLALQDVGVSARLFRPPGGSTSVEVETTALELGMRVVLWSVDPRDWRNGVSSAQIVRDVLSNVRAGSIVIMHDGGGDQSATWRALPKIIRGIRKKHLRLKTIR